MQSIVAMATSFAGNQRHDVINHLLYLFGWKYDDGFGFVFISVV